MEQEPNLQKCCESFVPDRGVGEGRASALQDECCRSWDGAPGCGMEMVAEHTEVACHNICHAVVPSVNRDSLIRVHMRQTNEN